jgi:uncharacterized protein (TIGR02453 family)
MMITTDTLHFLRELSEHNNKKWFDEQRHRYQQASGEVLAVVGELLDRLGGIDPGIESSHLEPARCVMRINRDIRFSKDKTPYKTNFFAFMNKGGKKSPSAGYYINIQPAASFYGGGIYMPETAVLTKIRQRLDQRFDEFRKIIEQQDFRTMFPDSVQPSGELKNPPRGFAKDSKALAYLKYKGYFTQRFATDEELTAPHYVDIIVSSYAAVQPLVDFINRAIDES